MTPEYYDDYDIARVFRDCSMTSKRDVLFDIDYKLRKIEEGSGLDTKHSAAFYIRLKDLLLRFKAEVEKAVLFDELDDYWAYDVDVDDTGITLILFHVYSVDIDEDENVTAVSCDQQYDLIKVNAKMLTVEDYANMYEVTVGGVRQWIRRGKLRSAVKTGRDWRIPELAEVSGRGYSYVGYRWQDELSDIPEEYAFLKESTFASISQDVEKKDLFHIRCTKVEKGETLYQYEVDMDGKEKEKFELVLISNPLIKAPAELKSIFRIIPEENN